MVQICAHQGLRYRQFLVKVFFLFCFVSSSLSSPQERSTWRGDQTVDRAGNDVFRSLLLPLWSQGFAVPSFVCMCVCISR